MIAQFKADRWVRPNGTATRPRRASRESEIAIEATRRDGTNSRPTHLEEQAEAYPLVVPVRLAVVTLTAGVVHAGVRNADAHLLLKRLLDGVRGVYPTVSVEHVFRYVLGVHTVDRVADVLARGDNQAERGQQHHSQTVVHPEHGRVNVHVADFYQALQAPEHVKHGVPGRRDTPSVSPAFQSPRGLSASAGRQHHHASHSRPLVFNAVANVSRRIHRPATGAQFFIHKSRVGTCLHITSRIVHTEILRGLRESCTYV